MKTRTYKLHLFYIPDWVDMTDDFEVDPVIEIPQQLDQHINHFATLVALPQFRDEEGEPWPMFVTFRAPLVKEFDPDTYIAYFEVNNKYMTYWVQHKYDRTLQIEYDVMEYYGNDK